MMIVRIIGGLGNQMFQYAFFKSLIEKKHNVKCDVDGFKNYKLHSGLELERVFNIKLIKALPSEIDKLTSIYNKSIIAKVKRNIFGDFCTHVSENNFSYVNFKENSDLYLDGYWQSEAYFGDNSLLRSTFVFNELLNSENLKLVKRINCCNSVSLHVRRGDYQGNSIYSLCDESYYINAIKILESRQLDIVLFIFSDDMLWVKNKLLSRVPEKMEINLIENNNDDSSIDMRLMSLCRNNIIANSSFSWWGAWLNQNEDKTVIAPKKWYTNKVVNAEQMNKLPKSWITL